MKILEDRIIFDNEDWLAGLDEQFDAGAFQVTKQLPQARSLNPYRYRGMLSPGFQGADVANVAAIDAIVRKAVVRATVAWAISGGTKLHQITALDTTPSITNGGGSWPRTITGASAGQDINIYWCNVSGTRKELVFYTWKDGSNGNMGIYDILAGTFNDDWMSTIPANAATFDTTYDHPIITGDDDIQYLGDGNNVHAVDGVTGAGGTLTKNVWTLPKEYVITSFIKHPQGLIVLAYKSTSDSNVFSGEARAFFFNFDELDPFKVVNLNDSQVSEGFVFQGTYGCFTQGRPSDQFSVNSKVSKLCLYDGFEFKPVVAFDKNIPIRGGVDIKGDLIQWNSQGTIYTWDNKLKILTQTAEGAGTTTGLLATLNRTQFISSGTTTSGGLQTISSNFFSQTLVYSPLARPSFPVGFTGKIIKVRIKFGKTSSGGRSMQLTLRDRNNDVASIIGSSPAFTAVTAANLVKEYNRTHAGGELGTFDTLRAVVGYEAGSGATDAPIVDTVEVFYKKVAIPV